jgi:hypothetical protein
MLTIAKSWSGPLLLMKNPFSHGVVMVRRLRAMVRSVWLLGAVAAVAQAESWVFDASGSFVAPAGVTRVTVEAWGGGGGGGYNPDANPHGGTAGGGGGGGGYSKRVLVPVTPGQSYDVVVGVGGAGGNPDGLAGGDSSFEGDGGVRVLARGGAGGKAGKGGNGGASGIGDAGLLFAGGRGGDGVNNAGGGGGGAARPGFAGAAGGNGSGVAGGAGGQVGGGKGGDKNDPGQDGSQPGAGGGGMGREGASAGNGAAGRVVIAATQQSDVVQTGMILEESQGMVGGGVVYRPMPGVMNEDGSYVFPVFAKIGQRGVVAANDELLLTNSSGTLRVVAREGSPVATGGYLSSGFHNLLLSSQGRALAMDQLRGTPGMSRSKGMASLISPDGVSLELIKQTGGTAAAGGQVASVGANVVVDGADRIYYTFSEAGRPANRDSRLDSESADGTEVVSLLQEGQDVSPLTGDRAWLGQIVGQIAAGGSRSALVARLQNNPDDKKQRTLKASNEVVLTASAEEGLSVVLRKGQVVDETDGAKIKILHGVARSGNGRHAILASLTKPAQKRNNQVLLFEDDGRVRVVARKGVTEIVPGLSLERFGQSFVTLDGAVVFQGWLAGTNKNSDGVLCRWTVAGGLELIAREGDPAPGSGYNHGVLNRVSVSPGGVILFQSHLDGRGLQGVVYRVMGDVMEKLVQTGEQVLFEGAPTQVLALAIYSSTGTGGCGEAVNDAGQAVISLSLGNGRHVNRIFE